MGKSKEEYLLSTGARCGDVSLRIAKKKIPVLIHTVTHRIEGNYFMLQNARLLDDLNGRHKDFVPLTEAKISSLAGEGEILIESDFLAINRNHIVLFTSNPRVMGATTTRIREQSRRFRMS